ncbi:hypothetical protein CROQUDRAFT_97620 [Cronartium quercuum f. sp. fusiforme G11]|uniref:Uncharacterized protein n=1 Tax=Cronartium quercuum f. sp. fusiforme G11 TaxID=708437 RepID=A0A9P6N9D4_9BASI|nr:hypothetical protein CROQUDRAFT_97620 [Cronartium quercuum f. sp. fusiforme G11]
MIATVLGSYIEHLEVLTDLRNTSKKHTENPGITNQAISQKTMSKSSLEELQVLTEDLSPSAITSQPAIQFEYAASEDTGLAERFIADDLELLAKISGFNYQPKNTVETNKHIGKQATNPHDPHYDTQVVELGTQHESCAPWQVAPEVMDPVMDLDLEVGTQVSHLI